VTELVVKGGRVEFVLPDFVTNAAALIFDRLTQTDVDTVSPPPPHPPHSPSPILLLLPILHIA
jgi:hypothetical protein